MPANTSVPHRRYTGTVRFAVALPCALVVGACYSPNAEVTTGDDDDDSTGSADSTGSPPTTSASTTTADTSGTQGSSGSSDSSSDVTHGDTDEDAPPEIENFEVQGSQMPAEILMADTVVLQADVSDDVAVARVEFYDGDELVATVDGAPYRTEFLVTSADNGGHSYTAIAYDSSDQTDEAGPIPLSVGIDGGAVVELREDIYRAVVSVALNSPYLVGDDTGVTVVGTTEYDGGTFSAYRTTAARYSLGLSLTWSSNYPSTVLSVTPDHYSFGRGGVDEDGALRIPCNVGVPLTESTLRILEADPGADVPFGIGLTLGAESGGAIGGLTVLPDFDIVVGSGVLELSRYSPALSAPSWTADISAGLGDGTLLRLHHDSTGAVLVDGISDNLSFLRKVSPDGDILWTRDSDEDGTSDIGFSAVGPDDQVTQIIQRPAGSTLGLRARTYDPDGVLLEDTIIAENEQMYPHDVAYEPSGTFIIVATHVPQDGATNAWVGRFEPDGSEVWTTTALVDTGDEEGYAVHVRPDARVFVSGIANTIAEFLSTSGDVWIAELAL